MQTTAKGHSNETSHVSQPRTSGKHSPNILPEFACSYSNTQQGTTGGKKRGQTLILTCTPVKKNMLGKIRQRSEEE